MKNKTPALLKMGLLTLFILAVIFAAYIAYTKAYEFFLSFDVAQIPGLAIQNNSNNIPSLDGTLAPTSMPSISEGPAPDPWDGASRVTMLVMGLDYRDWESGEGPPRTDTMILLSVDPLT